MVHVRMNTEMKRGEGRRRETMAAAAATNFLRSASAGSRDASTAARDATRGRRAHHTWR